MSSTDKLLSISVSVAGSTGPSLDPYTAAGRIVWDRSLGRFVILEYTPGTKGWVTYRIEPEPEDWTDDEIYTLSRRMLARAWEEDPDIGSAAPPR